VNTSEAGDDDALGDGVSLSDLSVPHADNVMTSDAAQASTATEDTRRAFTNVTLLRLRAAPKVAPQRNRTSNVAIPKIFLPADFAETMTTPLRVAGSRDLIRPLNSMSVPSAAETIAGADNRTV
jgi:hypothetical protein